ncbi:MAG TPA: SRPBCC family protein [Pseudonocardia sp.]|nr:SRPBCC family protein [Pseudonocardia sp.]
MAEFEAERGMTADAERVFAVVADLERLPSWLPSPVDVRPTGDGGVHADVPDRGVDAEGTVRVQHEQLRVEWGHAPDYAGWLQVEHADPGRSSVVLHLSFLGDQPETHGGAPADEVQRWLDDALTRLDRLVAEA